ncbi:MAG: aspartate-semialdehyde dehydrogenase, partial [Clostridia bacterium]|nr:aspartate-semialdehyde dehydrogenase [Clostridia bacterium]
MITCAIVGATGLVGSTFLKVLEEKNLAIDEYYLFASKNSKGKKIKFMDKEHIIEELTPEIPSQGFTYALFSAGSDISKEYAKEFTKHGTI